MSRRGKMLTALQLAGLAIGGAMMVYGGMYGLHWSIGVAAGAGIGFTIGIGLARFLEDVVTE